MAKAGMTPGFAKFAARTTKGTYDEARKGERIGRGIPFPIGTKGTAVVSSVICDETKADEQTGEKHPRLRVELKIETPEAGRGKSLSGPGIMQTIKAGSDPSKWSEEQAFGAALGILENCGLPEEISKGYKDFQECIDWFEEEPRRVHWEIQENNYVNKRGQEVKSSQIAVYPFIDEAAIPSADDSNEEAEVDPDATYCTYRGGKHQILSEEGDMIKIKGVKSGTVREVSKDEVEVID